MSSTSGDESRDGVPLTNLDQALFDGAGATKRDLVEYLDGVRDRIIPVLEDRPLSVIRVHRGQEAFMQKNVPKYTPPWVRTVHRARQPTHDLYPVMARRNRSINGMTMPFDRCAKDTRSSASASSGATAASVRRLLLGADNLSA